MNTSSRARGDTAQTTAREAAPETVRDWMRSDDALLIDVREDFERAEELIPDSEWHPLGQLDPVALHERHAGRRLVFHCRSGKRSAEAAKRFSAEVEHDAGVFTLAGGIERWKAERLPVIESSGRGLPIMRQVQIAAGSLVLLGVALGALASPWWLAISAFVGAGLTFAGVTGWCGMAKLLGRAPWNRRAAGSGDPGVTTSARDSSRGA